MRGEGRPGVGPEPRCLVLPVPGCAGESRGASGVGVVVGGSDGFRGDLVLLGLSCRVYLGLGCGMASCSLGWEGTGTELSLGDLNAAGAWSRALGCCCRWDWPVLVCGGTSGLESGQLVQERGAQVQERVREGVLGKVSPLLLGLRACSSRLGWRWSPGGEQAVEMVAGEAEGIVYESRE